MPDRLDRGHHTITWEDLWISFSERSLDEKKPASYVTGFFWVALRKSGHSGRDTILVRWPSSLGP